MSEFSGNDDFEKVEPDNYGAFQDESITSSSMQGDMAEEDRYPSNEQDLLGDFSVGGMMASSTNSAADPPPAAAPLINFGENLMNPESTVSESAPDSAPEPVTESKPVKPSAPPAEGCWMKNVDPRDEDSAISDPSVADMDEQQNTANTAAAAATDYATTAFEQAADSVTAPETVTGQSGGQPSGQPSQVLEIIYWRDVKKTGVVFGSMMFVLLSLSLCSLLSVLAYLSLAVLAVTFSFRVYKSVMQAVQKTNEGHPFKKLMDLDIELRGDVVQDAAQKIAENVNNCSRELRRLYLVGDYVDSLKFGLLLWLMTYIGSWFNGMTLVILLVVSIFTLPKVYETYQGPIDQNVNLVRAQLNNIMAQVSAKIPFPKKKAKTQ